MPEIWISQEDCEIVRPGDECNLALDGCAVLMDATEGTSVFVLPNGFTDNQIWECLRVANAAYGHGHRAGMSEKARDIRKALDIQ